MTLSPRTIALLLVVANLAWAGGYIANKFVLQHFSLWQVLLGRVCFASICYLALWRRYMPVRGYRKGDWRFLLAMTACEPCLLFTFETTALQYTTASQVGMIAACYPVAVAVGAWFWHREAVGRRAVAGIAAAVVGVVLVSAAGGKSPGAPMPLLGNALALLAVLSASAYALLVKKLSENYSFLFISALQCLGGTLFFLPKALAAPWPGTLPLSAWAWMLYLGIGITFFAYLTMNFAICRMKAAHVSMFSNLIPVFALILAFVFLGERLTPLQYGGAALVLGGVFWAGAPEEARRKAPVSV